MIFFSNLIWKFVQIKWIHKDTIISTTENLTIENVRTSNQGEYICTATNGYGTNSTKFNLTVLSKHLTFFRRMYTMPFLQTYVKTFLLFFFFFESRTRAFRK